MSISEIGKKLRQSLEKDAETGQTDRSNTVQTADKTVHAYSNNDMKEILDNLIQNYDRILEEKEKHYRELQEKDFRISELEKANQTILDNLKLLPEGKTPEQIKADWENQQKQLQEKKRIIDEICVFRRKPDAHSDPFRTVIPIDSGHRFRSIPETIQRRWLTV